MQQDLHSVGMWAEKVVLITGASDGIGASCARAFSQRGARLVLTALPGEDFRSEESDTRLVIAGDITSAETRITVVKPVLANTDIRPKWIRKFQRECLM